MDIATLLLADARTPTGAYAYSAGLEGGVWDGVGADDVPEVIRERLRGPARNAAAATVLAWDAAADPASASVVVARVAAIDERLAATMPSGGQRDVQARLGRSLVRLLVELYPTDAVLRTLRLDGAPMAPVALGVAARTLGIPRDEAALASCYQEAQTIAAASLKLLPTDPFHTTRWLIDARSDIAAAAASVADVHALTDLPAWGAPQTEYWHLDHSLQTRRLFNG